MMKGGAALLPLFRMVRVDTFGPVCQNVITF